MVLTRAKHKSVRHLIGTPGTVTEVRAGQALPVAVWFEGQNGALWCAADELEREGE